MYFQSLHAIFPPTKRLPTREVTKTLWLFAVFSGIVGDDILPSGNGDYKERGSLEIILDIWDMTHDPEPF